MSLVKVMNHLLLNLLHLHRAGPFCYRCSWSTCILELYCSFIGQASTYSILRIVWKWEALSLTLCQQMGTLFVELYFSKIIAQCHPVLGIAPQLLYGHNNNDNNDSPRYVLGTFIHLSVSAQALGIYNQSQELKRPLSHRIEMRKLASVWRSSIPLRFILLCNMEVFSKKRCVSTLLAIRLNLQSVFDQNCISRTNAFTARFHEE